MDAQALLRGRQIEGTPSPLLWPICLHSVLIFWPHDSNFTAVSRIGHQVVPFIIDVKSFGFVFWVCVDFWTALTCVQLKIFLFIVLALQLLCSDLQHFLHKRKKTTIFSLSLLTSFNIKSDRGDRIKSYGVFNHRFYPNYCDYGTKQVTLMFIVFPQTL